MRQVLRVASETFGGATLARGVYEGICVDQGVLLRVLRYNFRLLYRFGDPDLKLFNGNRRCNEFSSFQDDARFKFLQAGLRVNGVLRYGKRPFRHLSSKA